MSTVKVHKTQLRFSSKKQKDAIKKLAVKNGRSINAEINQAIDLYIVGQFSAIKSDNQPI